LKLNADLGAFTWSPSSLPSVVAISSEMPSLSGSLFGSPPMFLNASTAIDAASVASGRGVPGVRYDTRVYADASATTPPATNISARPGCLLRCTATGAESAALNADVVENRSAGDFASDLAMACSMNSGMSGRLARSGGTGSSKWRAMSSRDVVPKNGACPESISYTTQPSA
jgi:hypothetical protein